MKTILQINSSLSGKAGESTRLADELVANLGGNVVVRDLAANPLPHLDSERFGAFLSKPGERTPAQQRVIDESDALIAELRAADTIVLSVPMYNFGVPSQLKAWFDHVARAGVTFRYTDQGAVGLLTGKKAYVVATRGGYYNGTPNDHQAPYLRQFLGFLGITDVEFAYAEGLAVGAAAKENGLAAARAAIRNFAPILQAA